MTQSEINAKAMADIFALEDSKGLFEAIGILNDDDTMNDAMGAQAEPDYGPDDMLTVIPGSDDQFAGQSLSPQVQQEPSDEDKRFVVDRFNELMTNEHKNVVDPTEIETKSPIIQRELGVGSRMNVSQFLTDMMNSATQRLSAQNVSEAQPTGVATDDIAPQGSEQEAPVDPMAADQMGTPAMEPAPGGIAPEPSLDANVDEMGGLDGITDDGMGGLDSEPEPPEPEDDGLGLDGITDDALGGDDLGGDAAAPEGDDGLGGDDLGLDGITDDGFEDSATAPEAGEGDDAGIAPEEGDGAAPEDDVLGDSNLDSLSDGEFDDSETGDTAPADDDTEEDAEFEAEMTAKKAQLESIYANYIEDRARTKIRSMVESYMAKKEQKAKLESAKTETAKQESEAQLESVAAEKRAELGDKVASLVESSKASNRAKNVLEAAKRAYAKVNKANQKDAELDSMLESISTNYHKVQAEKKASEKLNAKLESIVNKYKGKAEKPADAPKAKLESVQDTKSGLNAQLQAIIDSL